LIFLAQSYYASAALLIYLSYFSEIIVNAVQTSRGRNTKRISIASLMKSGRRSSGYSGSSRKKFSRKKAKVEDDSKMISVIKTELIDEEEVPEDHYENEQNDMYIQAKEEKAEADERNIVAEEAAAFDSEAPTENIENINAEESPKIIAEDDCQPLDQDGTANSTENQDPNSVSEKKNSVFPSVFA